MTALRVALAKLRAILRRGRDEVELAEELATHVDLLAEDLQRDGLAPDEARRQARLRFGGTGQVAEAARDERGIAWLDDLARDLRLGLRSLRRNPLFTLTATLSLAVGVAANTVGFAFLYGYLIRPLPFTGGARLVSILAAAPSRGQDRWSTSLDEFRAVAKGTRSFEAVAANSVTTFDLSGSGEPRRLETAVVSPGLLQMLGTQPILGRLFWDDDVADSGGRVVLLSEGSWRTIFNGDPGVVGRTVALSGEPFTVVGVLPAWPAFSSWSELTIPISARHFADPKERRYHFVARLARGSTIEQANRELEVLSARLAKDHPDDNRGVQLFAEDLRSGLLGEIREPVLVLYAVVCLVLLLACANAATLLVMRSVSHAGEFGIRASLGAGRLQIVRQVLAEHALLTLAGGLFGLLAGLWARDALAPLISRYPGPFRFDLDGPASALLALVVLACAFLFGAVSAWSVARHALGAPNAVVPDAARGRTRLRTGLAVFEVALAVLVLVGTGLMLKGALRVARQPAGFDPRGVLTMEVALPVEAYPPEKTVQFFRTLAERVRALPGVESASASNPAPFIGWSVACDVEGMRPGTDRPRAMDIVAMPGYFRTLRIPLLAGRDVAEQDAAPNAAPVIVVSQTFARAAWPGRSPIGRRVRLTRAGEPDKPWREVVGVVGDIRTSTFTPPGGWVYLPHGQPPITELILAIRVKGDPAPVIRAVQRLVWKEQPALPMHWNRLLDEAIAERYWQPRVLPRLFSVFAALALVVALVGVYGVVAYASARRTREFGIRLAIGSPASGVWKLVARQGLRLAVSGTALGMAAAFGLMRLASAVFFGVSATDGWTYAACGALAVAAVMAASAGPAFRAARIDPVTVLRCE